MIQVDLKDSCYLYDEPNITHIVTEYEIGDYCGSGTALIAYKDGKFATASLGHCSCYGPGDGIPSSGGYTCDEVFGDSVSPGLECSEACVIKMKELLGIK